MFMNTINFLSVLSPGIHMKDIQLVQACGNSFHLRELKRSRIPSDPQSTPYKNAVTISRVRIMTRVGRNPRTVLRGARQYRKVQKLDC